MSKSADYFIRIHLFTNPPAPVPERLRRSAESPLKIIEYSDYSEHEHSKRDDPGDQRYVFVLKITRHIRKPRLNWVANLIGSSPSKPKANSELPSKRSKTPKESALRSIMGERASKPRLYNNQHAPRRTP